MTGNKLPLEVKVELIRLLAEGKSKPEIQVALAHSGHYISLGTIQFYKRTHRQAIYDAAREMGQLALVTGLSARSKRVENLKKLADSLAKDMVKTSISTYEKVALVREFRATLDQIRKEVSFIEDHVDDLHTPIEMQVVDDVQAMDTATLRQLTASGKPDADNR